MKTINFFVVALIAVFIGVNSFAQNSNSSTFKVSGNCEMCKATIEKAAKSAGASKAEWNIKTKVITVNYDSSKIKLDDIHKKIAAAGYDTEKVKADNQVYAKLPGCCKYRK